MIINIKTIKTNDEDRLIRLVVASFAIMILINTINCIINVFVPNTPIDTIVCYLFFSVIIVMALPTILFRLSKVSIVVFFILLLVYLIAFINPNSSNYAQGAFTKTLIEAFPFFILGQSIRDESKLKESLVKISPYMIITASIYYLIILTTGVGIKADYMTFSYSLLPFSCMQLLSCLEKPAVKKVFFVFLALCVHILTGTRGPLICLIACLIFGIFFTNISKKIRAFIFIVAVALGVYISSPLFTSSIEFLNVFFLNIGVRNRILTKILSEKFWDGSGRESVADIVLNAIFERPFFGYGFLGDRSVQNGGYPHNFVLELWCQFGVVLGTIIILALIIQFIKVFKQRKKNSSLYIMLFSVTFIKLLMSGTYPFEGMFFFLLGICFNKWLNEINSNNTLSEIDIK